MMFLIIEIHEVNKYLLIMKITREKVIETLREVIDPHAGMNLVDLGVIQGVEIEDDSVTVTLKPTSPFCPITDFLVKAVKEKLEALGIDKVEVKLQDALS